MRIVTTQRIPPHNLDAEQSVLGALLLSRDAVITVSELGLTSDDFYRPSHQHVYEAMRVLVAKGEPVDVVTVADELRRDGLLDDIGGPQYLTELQAVTPAISNAGRYARIVRDTAALRRLIRTSGELAELAYDNPDDVQAALELAESKVFALTERRDPDSLSTLAEVVPSVVDDLEAAIGRRGAPSGVATGYRDVDTMLSGLQPSALYVIGARPAMGKTAFGLGMAAHIAKGGEPVLFVSLEMGRKELTARLLSSEARVDSARMRSGNMTQQDWSRISRALGEIEAAPLYIDDNPLVTITEIRGRARRLKAQHGRIGCIVIDYLQLMTSRNKVESRQVEVAELSRSLKIMARELAVPVVALSQLSRGVESRADKRPMLADLRESGAIEQDADVVMFLYRDEVYNADSPDRGVAEVIVAKHRNGPIGTKRLVFMPTYTRFDSAALSL